VTGIVYFNFDIAQTLCRLIFVPPLDACNYIGIDSGASPLSVRLILCYFYQISYKSKICLFFTKIKLSLFFDIILPCCRGITKEEYLNGSFKTNNFVPFNKIALLKQARVALWSSLNRFKVTNLTVYNFKYFYLDNHTIENRKKLVNDFELLFNEYIRFREFDTSQPGIRTLNSLITNSKIVSAENSMSRMINTLVEDSEIKIQNCALFFNCHFKNCRIEVGENTILNDVLLVILNV